MWPIPPGYTEKKGERRESWEKDERHKLGLVVGNQAEQALARLVKGREEQPSRKKRDGQRSRAAL